MKPALVLVDLQNDFLASPHLRPPAEEVVQAAARLLEGCRAANVPVTHVRTTVSRDVDDRMPHWRLADRWECVAGTEGHAAPMPLRPRGEVVIDKTFFSAFSTPALEGNLRDLGVDTIILAGVHLHGCVRATALDAYARGLHVWIAEDAVGSFEPLHAATTKQYLRQRLATFADVDTLLIHLAAAENGRPRLHQEEWIEHRSPRLRTEVLWRLPVPTQAEIAEVTSSAAAAGEKWRRTPETERIRLLEAAEALVASRARELADRISREVGKPLHYARAEIDRAIALLRATRNTQGEMADRSPEAVVRRVPIGTVAQITPWNNPLAIPVGKLAPALHYGNAVVLKPAPAASGIAAKLVELLHEAGYPPELVGHVHGDAETAAALMADPAIDAVSLTGSSQAGYAAQAICSERRIPLQAELGGNNAAIVWSDCDLASTAAAIAEGGLGAAGQRCTANRRAIVDQRCYRDFADELQRAAAALKIGDPLDPAVRIGPLISDAAGHRVAAAVERARSYAEVREPRGAEAEIRELVAQGPYYPPVLVLCDDPSAEIVQKETFGPVVVVQPAASFDQALELLNGVPEGLVAALFSESADLRARFLRDARAGVLKIGRATADVGVQTPFGGWKDSGVGPPEHGTANLDFYTRTQAVYS